MKVLWKELVIGTILLLSFTQLYGAEISSRKLVVSQQPPMVAQPKVVREKPVSVNNKPTNDMDLANLANCMGTIPLIGGPIKGTLNYIGQSIIRSNQLTNGAIARILGGALPCVITLKKGISCSGTSVKGGVYGIIEEIIMALPPYIMPEAGKKIVLFFIKVSLNPMADVLFGGIRKARRNR